jgi:hypothetical protein
MNVGRAACIAAAIGVAALTGAGCQAEQAPAGNAEALPQTATAPPAQASEVPVTAAIPFTPPPLAYAGELPPFPTSPYPAPRPPEVIQAVYTFAARHPEVLHYVPCFCGCQRMGHSDNDDCFIKSREANGRPTWEPHGMT